MTAWVAVLAAGALCLVLKVAGHVVPGEWLAGERVRRVAGLVTVALLAALVAVQSAADGRSLTLDARVPALVVAAGALLLRAPFIVVVVLAGATAAGLRALS